MVRMNAPFCRDLAERPLAVAREHVPEEQSASALQGQPSVAPAVELMHTPSRAATVEACGPRKTSRRSVTEYGIPGSTTQQGPTPDVPAVWPNFWAPRS